MMMKLFSIVSITCIFCGAIGKQIAQPIRDPFLLPASVQMVDERYAYSVSELKLVALIHQGDKSLIQLSDPKKHLYTLQKGDCIGLEKAKITEVTNDHVTIAWRVQGQLFTDQLSGWI